MTSMNRWDEMPSIHQPSMTQEKEVVYSRFVWVHPNDLDFIYGRINKVGTLDCEEPEDPKETGDPYRLVRHFSMPGDGWAEVFCTDAAGTKVADIRLTVPMDPEEERAFRTEAGLGEKTLEEEMGETCSATLSAYMRRAMNRILG